MSRLIRAYDWKASSLGPMDVWPQSLRTAVMVVLATPQPALVAWGPKALTIYNDAMIPLFAHHHPGALGRPIPESWAETADDIRPMLAEVMAGRAQSLRDAEFKVGGREVGLTPAWFSGSWTPIRDPGGDRVEGFVVMLVETTDRVLAERALRRTEDRQTQDGLLVAELQHRVRNVLAVVRSVARRTAATSQTVEAYGSHLDGRLSALARTQAAVIRDPGGGVELEQLIAEELLAHAAREDGPVHLRGPSIRLTSRAAETLGLAVHELVTNSIKHGALSEETGQVDVRWSVVVGRPDAVPVLQLAWRETGASIPGSRPKRRGFGSEVLEQTLRYQIKAETRIAFSPGVFACTITVPLNGNVLA